MKQSIGRMIVEEKMKRAREYRNNLDQHTRCMKHSSRWSAFAHRMFYRNRVREGINAMQEARYHQDVAGLLPE